MSGNPETRTDPTGNRFIDGSGDQGWVDPSSGSTYIQIRGSVPKRQPHHIGADFVNAPAQPQVPKPQTPKAKAPPTSTQIGDAKDDAGLDGLAWGGIASILALLAVRAAKVASALGQVAFDLGEAALALDASFFGAAAGIALGIVAVAVGVLAATFSTLAAASVAWAGIATGVAAVFGVQSFQHAEDTNDWNSAAMDGLQSRADGIIGAAGTITTIFSAARMAVAPLSGVLPGDDMELVNSTMGLGIGALSTGAMIGLANSQVATMRSDLGE